MEEKERKWNNEHGCCQMGEEKEEPEEKEEKNDEIAMRTASRVECY